MSPSTLITSYHIIDQQGDPTLTIGIVASVLALMVMTMCMLYFWKVKSCSNAKPVENASAETDSLDDRYDNEKIGGGKKKENESRINSSIGLKSQVNLLSYDSK